MNRDATTVGISEGLGISESSGYLCGNFDMDHRRHDILEML